MRNTKVMLGAIISLWAVAILIGCGENMQQKINRYIGEMGSRAKTPVRDAYSDQLKMIGKPAVNTLIKNMEGSNDKMIRAYCAITLGKIGDPIAEDPIKKVLKDEAPEVRAKAANGLCLLIDKRAVPSMIELLKDKDSNVRDEVKRCLVSVLKEESRGVAIDRLIEELDSPDLFLRNEARVCLGQFGRQALPKVLEFLRTATEDNVIIITAKTVADIGDKSALGALQEAADKAKGKPEVVKRINGAYNDLLQKP